MVSNSYVVPVGMTSPTTYTLSVAGGSGSGMYAAGAVVNISATVPSGQQFQSWSGATVASPTSSSTTITMPAANTTVTAVFGATSSSTPVITNVSPNPIPSGTVNVTITGTGFTAGTLAYESYGTQSMIQYAPTSVSPPTSLTLTIYQGAATTATFQVLTPGASYSNAFQVPVNSGPPPPQAIAPVSASVNLGATQQFTSAGATAFSATVGSITPAGLYTAPATMPSSANVTVTATGPGGNASATVTLVNPNPQIIAPVARNTRPWVRHNSLTQRAQPTGLLLNGTITSAGLYTAPSVWPASGTDTVSVTGPNGNATAAITLTPPTPVVTGVGAGNQLPLGIFSATISGSGFTAQSTVTLGATPVTAVYSGGALNISGFYGQSGPVNLIVTNATVSSQPFSVQVGVPNAQVSTSAARRFLQQAGFGPTPADAAHVQTIGFQAWLAEQFAMPQVSNYNADTGSQSGMPASVFGECGDQSRPVAPESRLRSQPDICGLAEQTGLRHAMVPYQNMLLADAFTNYLQILTDVTLSPAMGYYLDMANNEKANPALGTVANENYAREIMQLMSIGTKVLNPDGTWPVDSNNLPIPTYQQADVTAMARIFTGWTLRLAPRAARPSSAHT